MVMYLGLSDTLQTGGARHKGLCGPQDCRCKDIEWRGPLPLLACKQLQQMVNSRLCQEHWHQSAKRQAGVPKMGHVMGCAGLLVGHQTRLLQTARHASVSRDAQLLPSHCEHTAMHASTLPYRTANVRCIIPMCQHPRHTSACDGISRGIQPSCIMDVNRPSPNHICVT